MFHKHFLSILNGLDVIRLFLFGWDFPTGGENLGVFEENDPKKDKISKNTCLEGTSLRQNTSFKLLCVKIGSRVWAVRVAKNKKNKNNNNKSHTTPKYHYHVGAPPLIWSQPNLARLVNPEK